MSYPCDEPFYLFNLENLICSHERLNRSSAPSLPVTFFESAGGGYFSAMKRDIVPRYKICCFFS